MFIMIQKLLSNKYNDTWKHKLIDFATDGVANMVRRLSGALTRLIDHFHGNVYCSWAASHQVDPVVHAVSEQYVKESFYVPLTVLTSYLCLQNQSIYFNWFRMSCWIFDSFAVAASLNGCKTGLLSGLVSAANNQGKHHKQCGGCQFMSSTKLLVPLNISKPLQDRHTLQMRKKAIRELWVKFCQCDEYLRAGAVVMYVYQFKLQEGRNTQQYLQR